MQWLTGKEEVVSDSMSVCGRIASSPVRQEADEAYKYNMYNGIPFQYRV